MTGEATFPGGVFSDRIDDGRAGAEIELSATGVRARIPDGSEFFVPYAECQLEVGGYSGRMIFCRNRDRSLTIFCEERTFADALSRASGGLLSESLRELLAARRRESRRGWWIAASLALGIAVVVVAGFLGVRAAARAAVHAMPIALDEKIGELALESMDLGGPEVHDPVVVGALESIVDRLAPHAAVSGLEFRLRVIDAPIVNAFALPGGPIVVYTGLIGKAADAEEVAGVIGHEMAHVIARHGLERIADSIGIVTAVRILVGDTQGLVAFGAELFTLASVNSYSRRQEMAADEEAVRMLHAAGIDPAGLARFFEVLDREQGDLPSAVSWISTHPQNQARIARIRDQLAALGGPSYQPLAVDWAEVRRRAASGA